MKYCTVYFEESEVKKMTICIILTVIAILLIIFAAGKIHIAIQFKKEVKALFSQSKTILNKTFSCEQISGLPEPVQRYFKYVLKEGQPYISTVRLTHDGQFRSGIKKDWVDIEGEQYFTAEKPGFIWKGQTALFTARDMYLSDKGKIIVSLFSLFNIMIGEGISYDRGELLRWLGESVWFPTNLLPNEYLHWTPIDSASAGLTFNYNDLSLYYKVSFNEIGEIMQLETERHMGEDDLETWIGKFSDYQEQYGIVIPTQIEAIWRLQSGDFSYARFHVKKIEYNEAEKF
jgi:hypothetical protein